MATKAKLALKPMGDRIVIKPIAQEERTASGLYLPANAQEKPMKGEVLAVGPGKVTDDGKTIKMEVKVGDKVLYGKYSGTEIKHDGEDFVIMQEREVLGNFTS